MVASGLPANAAVGTKRERGVSTVARALLYIRVVRVSFNRYLSLSKKLWRSVCGFGLAALTERFAPDAVGTARGTGTHRERRSATQSSSMGPARIACQ